MCVSKVILKRRKIMPIPIKPIEDNNHIDYSFLLNSYVPSTSKKVFASDNDASLLFKMWAKNDQDKIKVSELKDVNARDISRLKTMGFIVADNDEIKLTKKGRIIITTMALGEVNQFEKKKQEKKYTEILASMDKRGKKGYRIPKYATNNDNNIRL
jgi:hypothetical protein